MTNNPNLHLGRLEIGQGQESFDIFAQTDSVLNFDWFVNYISIYFNYDNQTILVRRCIVGVELEHLQRELEDLYAGYRCIPQEVSGIDLGLLWNMHWQSIALSESKKQPVSSWDWPGTDLLFLQSNSNEALSNNTFLYQDESGNYILQISSCYPHFFVGNSSSLEYDQWLPSYKILYRKKIAPSVIKQWIMQLEELCSFYRKNNHIDTHESSA